ncbi:MAG: glycosyltransferase family 1 protein [Porphyromonadaceae bacterium]|nr:glycosyltransferase family 1 protein [Porphyromonadaceae bacterium]
MESLRIGFDAKRLVANNTGLGNYSRFVLRALLEFHPEHTYYLFAPHRGNMNLYDDISSHPSVKMVYPEGMLKGSLWRTFGIAKVAKKLKLDVFHGLSNELPVGISDRVFRILTMHDLIYERFPKAYNPIDRFLYHLKYKKSCTRFSDHIISISQMTYNDLLKYYHLPKEKITVVYQGCRSLFYEPIDSDAIGQVLSKLHIRRPYFLSVGTFEWRKNFGMTIKALPNLRKEYQLVIVGRDTEYSKSVMNEAKQLGVADRIIRPSNLSDDELKALYAGAEVFIYPSRFEGFGIPVIESLVMGVPVVAAKGSCLEEAGGKGAFYVDPDNVDELAEKLNLLVSNSTLRSQMIDFGKQHVKQFDGRVIADQINQLYLDGVHAKK